MPNTKTRNVLLSLLTLSGLLFSLVVSPQASAAGVTVTIDPNVANVSATGNITLGFTSSAAVSTTGNIKIKLSTAYTGTPTFQINTQSATFTSTTTSSEITHTLTPGATVAAGSVSILISGLTTPSTAANYPFTIQTSSGDYGAAFQYVGEANVVQVTAEVLSTLSFTIRNSDDTANTNVCNLGTLSLTTLSLCNYRLKVSTNAANGYSVSMATSGNFTSGSHNLANADAGNNGVGGSEISSLTTGVERYGVLVSPGSTTTSGIVALANSYNAGGSNSVQYNNATPQALLTSSGANSPGSTDLANTVLVSHRANISTGTPPGIYTQTVTYTVTPSF